MITNEKILTNMKARAGEVQKELDALRKLEKESDDYLPDLMILIDNLADELKYIRSQIRR